MLPVMSFTVIGYLIFYFNYLRKLQNVVYQIWLDKSGNEIRVVYNNRTYRNFRRKQVEDIILTSSLVNPSKDSLDTSNSNNTYNITNNTSFTYLLIL